MFALNGPGRGKNLVRCSVGNLTIELGKLAQRVNLERSIR